MVKRLHRRLRPIGKHRNCGTWRWRTGIDAKSIGPSTARLFPEQNVRLVGLELMHGRALSNHSVARFSAQEHFPWISPHFRKHGECWGICLRRSHRRMEWKHFDKSKLWNRIKRSEWWEFM